jgi:hypothetical protein
MANIDQVQPQRLYRYRSLKKFERELEAIVEGYIYCAAYDTLNDPMEGVFRSSTAFRESEDYRQARANIVDNKTQIGLSSFSEVHDHELMWAHYADQTEAFVSHIASQNYSTISATTLLLFACSTTRRCPPFAMVGMNLPMSQKWFCHTRITDGSMSVSGGCLRHSEKRSTWINPA